jgi:hypothetical protein
MQKRTREITYKALTLSTQTIKKGPMIHRALPPYARQRKLPETTEVRAVTRRMHGTARPAMLNLVSGRSGRIRGGRLEVKSRSTQERREGRERSSVVLLKTKKEESGTKLGWGIAGWSRDRRGARSDARKQVGAPQGAAEHWEDIGWTTRVSNKSRPT